jgi:putative two-component system response regulator
MIINSLSILVIDDEPQVVKSISEFLSKHGFDVMEAFDGEEAIELWETKKSPVVLTDIDMPKVNGIEVLKHIKKDKYTQVVMFSGAGSMEDTVNSLRFGACDYLMKPVNFDILLHTINKCIERYHFLIHRDQYHEELEKEVKKKTSQLREMLDELINSLSVVTEIRDPYTAGHQRRVTSLSLIIAKELNYKRMTCIRYAGLLHDIGKIRVPSAILTKPTRLTETEFSLIKEHSEAAYKIIKNVPFDSVLGTDVAEIVYQHHERMDGSGYPRRLSGNEIMREARIIGICDVIESMSSHRPYRPALGLKVALDEIERGMNSIYDREISGLCLELLRPFQDRNLNDYLDEVN